MNISFPEIQNIQADWLRKKQLSLDVLRLDKIHPIVSGNKWFKLKYYLDEAQYNQKSAIATFGGAWSNHIVATAFAAKAAGLKSIGIIRGEKPAVLSSALLTAMQNGMQLYFVTRQQYRKKEDIINTFSKEQLYWINEGGYGKTGAKGAAEILQTVDTTAYTHIIAAVGTGTMLAGLLLASKKDQRIIGISSMKGNVNIENDIKNLLADKKNLSGFEVKHDYHFGGYGKHPDSLIHFINEVYEKHCLPLDIIYTGKTFFGIKDLSDKNYFSSSGKLLMIHSGGLQGNNSLPAKVLAF